MGFSRQVHGILQARILGWVAVSFSRGSSQPRDQTQASCVSCIAGRFFTTAPPGEAHIYIYPLSFRSPQSTEQSFLCYRVGSHQLSILHIVYICQSPSPNSSHTAPHFFLGIHTFVLSVFVSISVVIQGIVTLIF